MVSKSKYTNKPKDVIYKNKSWLYNQYIKMRKPIHIIADNCKVHYSTIRIWLIKYNIPIRNKSDAAKGYNKTTEHLEKLIKELKENPPFLGKKHSVKTKKKMSLNQLGKKNSFYGMKHTEKTRMNWSNNRKGKQNKNWKGGITTERERFYQSQAWKTVCRIIWKRDNSICKRCKVFIGRDSGIQFHIHHIISFKVKELRINPNNLVLLCKKCHNWIHSKKNIKNEFILDSCFWITQKNCMISIPNSTT